MNLFALTETWITPSTTLAELADATPPDFTLISTPRPDSPANLKQKIIGGGTAFLVHNSCTIDLLLRKFSNPLKCPISQSNS